jgi:hypothetical protein
MSKAPTGMEFVGKLPDVPADAFFPSRTTLTPGGVADAVRRLMSAVREATDARDAEIIALRKALAGSSEPSREMIVSIIETVYREGYDDGWCTGTASSEADRAYSIDAEWLKQYAQSWKLPT